MRLSNFILCALVVFGIFPLQAIAISRPALRNHVPRGEKALLFQQAGVNKAHRKYYVVDHAVPVELGGSNDFSNLQLQTRPEAKAKDRIEKYLLKKVRKGEISLTEAQHEAQDWKHVRVVERP